MNNFFNKYSYVMEGVKMKVYYYCIKEFELFGYVLGKVKILKFMEKYKIPEDEIIIKEKALHLVLLDFLTGAKMGRKRLKRFKKIEKLQNKRSIISNRIEFLEKYGTDWGRFR